MREFRAIVRIAIFAAPLLTVSASLAADLPVRMPVKAPPPAGIAPSWAGPYVGIFAGYGWDRADATAPFDANTGFFYNFTGAPYRADVDGFFGGGTLGINWQSGSLVFGFEGELGYLGLKGSAIDPNGILFGTPDTVTRFKSDLYGAAYGRLGVAAGNALFYGKGGVAFLKSEASTIDPCVAPPASCGTGTLTMTGSKTLVGWSGGGGVEWMFGPQWSLKTEYAYFDFGKINTGGPSNAAGEFYRQSIDVTVHTAKAGINYRWGAPLAARY
ncbi:MAG: outer membrane protein [Xanthobacteraceae bacterium]